MVEQWRDIPGFEGRYQVSDRGRVKTLAFRQGYNHGRTGERMYRLTKERIVAAQEINSGYLVVHLHRDNKRRAFLVHRLVAATFVTGDGTEVNHLNGKKKDNRARNLEWTTRTKNHLHAVDLRLNRQAVPVIDPRDGVRYASISQAAKRARVSPRTARAWPR